ncbi:ZrgA family zinc uptake protein, partial [Vibrio penaeicida]|uniref:ZrgA family zinc uptake protein n=1 Tax=Vibrio penaeicida TaxID=104609 RepID=UPI0011AB42C6
MNHVFKLSLLAAAIVTTSAHAEEFRQHDAHVHGVVELNIAQDGDELLMEIHAPGADVVGFESAPKNAEQKKQLANALSVLNQADKVMTLSSAAQCKPTFTEVRHTLGEDESHDDHDKHDHDKHEHHDDHDKHDHDKHEHHDD